MLVVFLIAGFLSLTCGQEERTIFLTKAKSPSVLDCRNGGHFNLTMGVASHIFDDAYGPVEVYGYGRRNILYNIYNSKCSSQYYIIQIYFQIYFFRYIYYWRINIYKQLLFGYT